MGGRWHLSCVSGVAVWMLPTLLAVPVAHSSGKSQPCPGDEESHAVFSSQQAWVPADPGFNTSAEARHSPYMSGRSLVLVVPHHLRDVFTLSLLQWRKGDWDLASALQPP